MNNVFEVPDELKHKVNAVDDNRQPGQEVKIDATAFVHLFRPELEKWLTDLAMQRAQNP